MLEKILNSLGISRDEGRLYLMLLEQSNPLTAGTLSKQSGMPRASIYGYLQNLQEKGLVRQSIAGSVKVFSPEPAKKIDLILEDQILEAKKNREAFKEILPKLEQKQGLSSQSPRFNFFEGSEGVRHILNDMFLYRDIKTYALWPISEMMEILSPQFFREHNIKRIGYNISVMAIWPRARVVDIKKYPFLGAGVGFLREIRILPESADLTLGYWIYKNKIAYLSSRRESYGFIIESAEMVKTMLTQFTLLWQQAKSISTKCAETDRFLKEIRS